MNREVYKHLLHTYGRNPAQWFGWFAVAVSMLITRVYVVIIVAQVTSNIASGDIDTAKRNTLYLLIAYAIGLLIGAAGELICLRSENNEYSKLLVVYHDKLIGKDMSFYRDSYQYNFVLKFHSHSLLLL